MNKRWAFALGILCTLAATPALAARDTDRYTSITVFGDSLVDAGNFYIASGQTQPDPDQGFFEHRFTNGYNYPDLLSIDLFGVPTTPSFAGGNNFGIAGGRIIDTADGIPDLQAQIGTFQASAQGVDPNGLYILNFGANDVFAAKGTFGPAALGAFPDTTSYLQAAAQQYVAGILTLQGLGVRNILMTDFPLVGDPFTIEANEYLNAALATLTLNADTDLFFYSISDFNYRILTEPDSFGLPLQRTDTFCIAAGAQASGCEGIFSFDGVHPTAAVQAAGYAELNQRFGLNASQAVPEPATWAMMLFGFGGIGLAMRRRRPVLVTTVTYG